LVVLVFIIAGYLIVRANRKVRTETSLDNEKPISMSSEQEKPIPLTTDPEIKRTRDRIPQLDYCPSCGTAVSPGSTFCSDCGFEFEE